MGQVAKEKELADLRSDQDVLRPTKSVILQEYAGIDLQNTTNNSQGLINSSKIIGQPLLQTKIKIIKDHLERSIKQCTLRERFMGNFLKQNNDLTVRIAEPTHGGRATLTEEN